MEPNIDQSVVAGPSEFLFYANLDLDVHFDQQKCIVGPGSTK